jgi:hypothetical protein
MRFEALFFFTWRGWAGREEGRKEEGGGGASVLHGASKPASAWWVSMKGASLALPKIPH